MKHFRVSPAARADLDDIWFYIAQDNVDAADKFIHAIVSRFPKWQQCRNSDDAARNYHHD
jgi:plasmid stabilization system protein ParE